MAVRYIRRTGRVGIRRWRANDEAEFVRAARASATLHGPWVTAPLNGEAFRAFLERGRRRDVESFAVVRLSDGAPAGWVNINNIVRRAFQSGALGYAGFGTTAGLGLVGEGVGLVVAHAFETLGLHRLEANIQPDNQASLAVVRRLGFRYEGFSPAFLLVDGAWRDHERWAVVAGPGPAAGDGDQGAAKA